MFFVIFLTGVVVGNVKRFNYEEELGLKHHVFSAIVETAQLLFLGFLIFFIIGGFLGKFFKCHWVAVLSTALTIFVSFILSLSYTDFYNQSLLVFLSVIIFPLAGILIAIDVTNPYWIRGMCLGSFYLLLPYFIMPFIYEGLAYVYGYAGFKIIALSILLGIIGLMTGIIIDVVKHKRKMEIIETKKFFLWTAINIGILLISYILLDPLGYSTNFWSTWFV